MVKRNKKRLYLELDERFKPGFHIALLLLPKGAKGSSPAPVAARFHATNPIDKDSGQVRWKYEEQTAVRARTDLIRALVYLGKVEDEAKMRTVLEGVEVVQDNPDWRCKNWAWDALDALVEAGVITLPGNGESIWKVGVEFAEKNPLDNPPRVILPTCSVDGAPMKSALEGF